MGGRVEAFSTGFELSEEEREERDDTIMSKYDVVSLYPSVNMEEFYPCGKWEWFHIRMGDKQKCDEMKLKFNSDRHYCMSTKKEGIEEDQKTIYPGIYLASVIPPKGDFIPCLGVKIKNRLGFCYAVPVFILEMCNVIIPKVNDYCTGGGVMLN